MGGAVHRAAAVLLGAALLAGCATLGGDRPRSAGDKLDPWQNWNRKVFAFNQALDKNVLVPVATGYRKVVPSFVRAAITNFFNNFADGWSAVNLFLQGQVEAGLHDTMRFATNTTFGIGGLVDIASDIGFEHHYEDLGQTLGKWGVHTGPYIVWPVLGPSTVRESVALPFDRMATPAVVFQDAASQGSISLLQLINTRAQFLDASRIIETIALDEYTFVRDAYLARRRSLVHDGDPPPDDEDDDAVSPPATPASAPASGPRND
jgi:phospholipid-binding lipoprotein MlaA